VCCLAPKKRQSERVKETARQVGADEASGAFDKIITAMARAKPLEEKR
jgi:hypothetical protein